MADTIWKNIHTNFVDLLTDSVTGVGSLTNISNTFTESTNYLRAESNPSSVFNGKFSIMLDQINEVREDIGTGWIEYDYDVKVEIAFLITTNVNRDTYNNAIIDIEEIIRKRLDVDTFGDCAILNITFINSSPMRFVNNENEEFGIIDLIFRVQGRSSINND